MQFIITIDTEGDNQWDPALPPGTENIKFVPRFQELCDRYRFPPTYLCTYEVVDSTAFDDVLLPLPAAGRAEIGAHLHPWTNPPFSEWDRSETTYAYPSELPAPVFSKKLEALTALLTKKLGAPPRSYRAGRWGLSAAHIPVLIELGYIVDCSVTPLLSWTDRGARERGQDFSAAPVTPYFMAWGDPGARRRVRASRGTGDNPPYQCHHAAVAGAALGVSASPEDAIGARAESVLSYRAAMVPAVFRYERLETEECLRHRAPARPARRRDDVPFLGAHAERIAAQSHDRRGRRRVSPPRRGLCPPGGAGRRRQHAGGICGDETQWLSGRERSRQIFPSRLGRFSRRWRHHVRPLRLGRRRADLPEAPVQVLRWEREADRPGGAANVAMNLTALGCRVKLVGIVGNDDKGRWLFEALRGSGVNTSGVIKSKDRPTTVKTRVIARGQHVLRVDRESRGEMAADDERRIIAAVKSLDGTCRP